MKSQRRAAIMPMFAITLPVMFILCFIAMNLSYMQLTDTELKIATDAAARAGGRALSDSQDLDSARQFAARAAALNNVSRRPLILSTDEADGQIVFGTSSRPDTHSRYEFDEMEDAAIVGGAQASGIRIFASQPTNLLFTVASISTFTPSATSVATQIDRDMALVIDRSGSMAYYKDEDYLYETITELYDDSSNGITEDEYQAAVADYQGVPSLADMPLNQREYAPSVLDLLDGDLKEYATTVNTLYDNGGGTSAPLHSRWALLEQGAETFFDILNVTAQIEQVSISSFAKESSVDQPLTTNLDQAEQTLKNLYPKRSTAIGDGMLSAITTLRTNDARPYAVKSIIVFTDGHNVQGTDPEAAARQIIDDYPDMIIHTITFTPGADKVSMAAVAAAANGKHYHADTGDELQDIFREIASAVPTIVTE